MKYYILMNGKRSVHTFNEEKADELVERLLGLFPTLEIKKEQVS